MRAVQELQAEPAAVGQARALLEKTLVDASVDPARSFEAMLVTSEIVSNAISHGSRPGDVIEIAFELVAGRLTIIVRDPARARNGPVMFTPDETRPAGRGLLIVDRLADWSERVCEGRREVRAEMTV